MKFIRSLKRIAKCRLCPPLKKFMRTPMSASLRIWYRFQRCERHYIVLGKALRWVILRVLVTKRWCAYFTYKVLSNLNIITWFSFKNDRSVCYTFYFLSISFPMTGYKHHVAVSRIRKTFIAFMHVIQTFVEHVRDTFEDSNALINLISPYAHVQYLVFLTWTCQICPISDKRTTTN